jgi:hypothetical protein
METMPGRGIKTPVLAVVAASLAMTGCGGSADEADQVVSDWLSAAAAQDGAAYCELLSTPYLEQLTGSQGDAALSKCEDQVTQGSGNLPVRITSGPADPRGENAADVKLDATVPSGTVSVIKEDDEFKIDGVQASAAQAPKPPPQQKKKQ